MLRRKTPHTRPARVRALLWELWEWAAMDTTEEGTARPSTYPATGRGHSSRGDARTGPEELLRVPGPLHIPWESDTIPRLEDSPEPLLRGWGTGPPQTLGPQNSHFLCRAEETKVTWKLSSPPCPTSLQGLAHKRELTEAYWLASYKRNREMGGGGAIGSSRPRRKQGHL